MLGDDSPQLAQLWNLCRWKFHTLYSWPYLLLSVCASLGIPPETSTSSLIQFFSLLQLRYSPLIATLELHASVRMAQFELSGWLRAEGECETAKIKHEEKQQQTTVAAAVAGYAKSRFFSNVSYTFSSFSLPSVNHSVTFFGAHYFFLYATSHTFTAPVVLLIVDRLKSIRIVCMQNVTVGGKVSCFCCVIFPLHLSTKKLYCRGRRWEKQTRDEENFPLGRCTHKKQPAVELGRSCEIDGSTCESSEKTPEKLSNVNRANLPVN